MFVSCVAGCLSISCTSDYVFLIARCFAVFFCFACVAALFSKLHASDVFFELFHAAVIVFVCFVPR